MRHLIEQHQKNVAIAVKLSFKPYTRTSPDEYFEYSYPLIVKQKPGKKSLS